MNKVNVEVLIPSISRRYDFLLPYRMKMKDAKELIIKAVCEFEGLSDNGKIETMNIWAVDKSTIISDDLNVEEANLFDGSRLILA